MESSSKFIRGREEFNLISCLYKVKESAAVVAVVIKLRGRSLTNAGILESFENMEQARRFAGQAFFYLSGNRYRSMQAARLEDGVALVMGRGEMLMLAKPNGLLRVLPAAGKGVCEFQEYRQGRWETAEESGEDSWGWGEWAHLDDWRSCFKALDDNFVVTARALALCLVRLNVGDRHIRRLIITPVFEQFLRASKEQRSTPQSGFDCM